MVAELLRHSDRPEVCELIPERLRKCHRPQDVTRDDAPIAPHSSTSVLGKRPRATMGDLFAADGDWALGPLNPVSVDGLEQADDEEDLLELAGF
jgi:hypothetical protein